MSEPQDLRLSPTLEVEGQPTIGQPTVGRSVAGQPTIGQSAIGQPVIGQPITDFLREVPPPSRPPREGPPFSYAGSKWRLSRWILSNIPRRKTFVITHCGTGCPLWHVHPPWPIEVINDLNGDIVNFFRVCRDRPNDLYRAIWWTPYSREEHSFSRSGPPTTDPVERARRFLTDVMLSFTGHYPNTFRFSRACSGSRAVYRHFRTAESRILRIAERLRNVIIEQGDAIECIRRYDTPDTCFYCDPPYIIDGSTRTRFYSNPYSLEDHIRLLETLNSIKGFAAISGYSNPLYDDLLSSWTHHTIPVRTCTARAPTHIAVTEHLWTRDGR